jgi:hypothetical protein
MINEKKLDIACEQFRNDIKNDLLFTVADLSRAVLTGCNSVTNKQHDKAQEGVDEYVRYKDSSLSYTEGDMVKAFEAGCRIMAAIVDKENEKVRMSMRVKREDMQRAMKLISAGQQMMDLASEFCKEAERALTKQGEYRTGIKNDFGKLKNFFRQIYSQVERVYRGFTPDECYEWGEDGEALEEAVRTIFKIDVYEEMNLNSK